MERRTFIALDFLKAVVTRRGGSAVHTGMTAVGIKSANNSFSFL